MNKDFLVEYKYVIEDAINNIVLSLDNVPEPLSEAMKYSLQGGGKRIRPILTLLGSELVNGDILEAIPYAMAIECVHNYSLIHDDLPCMDNDDYRRGRLTTHKKFGETVAVLAGDALLNYAYELMAHDLVINHTSGKIQAFHTIAQASGCNGMVKGQILDINNYHIVENIDLFKTGALIKAALLAGAMVGGANSNIIEDLTLYAESIGIAFQIADDILDVESTYEELGKPIGSDTENNKRTYVSEYGLDNAKKMLILYENQAVDIMTKYGDSANNLIQLARLLTTRTK